MVQPVLERLSLLIYFLKSNPQLRSAQVSLPLFKTNFPSRQSLSHKRSFGSRSRSFSCKIMRPNNTSNNCKRGRISNFQFHFQRSIAQEPDSRGRICSSDCFLSSFQNSFVFIKSLSTNKSGKYSSKELSRGI